jgi:quercetin dioxygenase-like cupin family protein/predicted nucleotidyltransferase
MKRSAVREAVGRFRAANPRVFGSVLHGTDRDGSDLDLLVDALPGAKGGSSRHAHRQLHDRTTSLPFKFELELISSLSGGTVKEGSPMTVESRIFSVAEYVQPSEGEPILSVVLETRDSIIVVWHVHPGQEIAAHIHPHGQDTWTVLSGMADYFQGNGIVRALREGEIAVARPGQVHGARNTGTEPFVFVSVVASANAGFVLAER